MASPRPPRSNNKAQLGFRQSARISKLFFPLTPLQVSSSLPTWLLKSVARRQDNLHCCLVHTQHQQTEASSQQLEVTWRQPSHSPGESSNKVALGWELVTILTTPHLVSAVQPFTPAPAPFLPKRLRSISLAITITTAAASMTPIAHCKDLPACKYQRCYCCYCCRCSAHHHFLCFHARCCCCCCCILLPDCGLAGHTSFPQTFSSHQCGSSKRRLEAGKTDQVGSLYGWTDIGLAGGSGGEQDCCP